MTTAGPGARHRWPVLLATWLSPQRQTPEETEDGGRERRALGGEIFGRRQIGRLHGNGADVLAGGDGQALDRRRHPTPELRRADLGHWRKGLGIPPRGL